ncbi:MAG: hypothetical protein Q4B86_03515 [Eubacteriales bacterium]|nr:hypothetical protein [Eubacteriales bacterium]
MKKNVFAVITLAMALSVATIGTSFASGSSSTGGSISGGGGGGGTSVGTGYHPGQSTQTAGAANGAGIAGTQDAAGKTVIGGTTAVYFLADKNASVAGLPENTVSQINGINNGQKLNELIKDVDLTGYNALINTQAFIMEDTKGNVVTNPTSVSLNIPNLLEGLNNVQILFYNNATGKWEVIAPTAVDFANKLVTVNLPGSGTLSVIYKK